MKEIEKNDVDVSKLFKWSKEYSIVDTQGNDLLKVFIRLVGDAEVNRARTFALRKSAEFRRKLHEQDSDERLAFIPELDLLDDAVLIESVLLEWAREFSQDAIRNLEMTLPVEPHSEATLEEQEKYQKEVDSWPARREALIRKYMEDRLESKRNELKELDVNLIYSEYIKLLINRLCENEMVLAYRKMCTYFGCYKNNKFKERVFESFEEFDNSSTEIKNQLMDSYLSLEIDGEDLKKSPGVMQ